ncbi:hypothetical protein MIND_00424200 [Mycena indigotica]|uniref:XPG-I domain-containing protein n=1 Tax=Mycena indigotica TaxID=2126181 RepID=A0A8H6SWC0_9AGAR|nr:uncharacterized protein MIND_00424200 [Mycena indigotica]KAF7306330.1 hypothetical protein MIND_00424200 [Mycena indigotica]
MVVKGKETARSVGYTTTSHIDGHVTSIKLEVNRDDGRARPLEGAFSSRNLTHLGTTPPQELEPASTVRSLTHLAVQEGFVANPDGKRGFRVGIDASIWFFHAEYGKEGENPELRTMFFRCATLMHAPFLPLFVFDGKHRPTWKRGKRINPTTHKLTNGMKEIVESFGFEWRTAPGEAEAELAYLNRIGVIDGILSDDVDNFLFGARTVIRNSSNNLSGNRSNPSLNANGKDDKNHSRVFRMQDIETHPDIELTRGDMILIGLCSGGDYDTSGMTGCGPKIARGLIRYGLGRSLYDAAKNLSRERLQTFLHDWRNQMRHELRTDSRGFIGRKQVSLSNKIPDAFPDVDILLSYVNPLTSESLGRSSDNLKLTWGKEPDLGKLAKTCEFYFEWGYRNMIIKRFKTVVWHGAVLRILRRGVLELDGRRGMLPMTPRKTKSGLPAAEGTPSKMIAKHFSSLTVNDNSDDEEEDSPLIAKITRSREHASTDAILEYRLEIHPQQLVRLAESGIQNIRRPEDADEYPELAEAGFSDNDDDGPSKGKKKSKWQELSEEEQRELESKPLMVWMPACMVRIAEPRLVREWEEREETKQLKKAGKGRAKKVKEKSDDEEKSPKVATKPRARPKGTAAAPKRTSTKSQPKLKAPLFAEEEEESSDPVSPPPQVAHPKPKKGFYVDVLTDEENEGDVLPAFPSISKPRPPPGVVRDLTLPRASGSSKVPKDNIKSVEDPFSQPAVRDLTRPQTMSKPAVRASTTKPKKVTSGSGLNTAQLQANMNDFFPLAKAMARKTQSKATQSAPVPLRPAAGSQPSSGLSAPIQSEDPPKPLLGRVIENENTPVLELTPSKLSLRPFPLSFDDDDQLLLSRTTTTTTRRRDSDPPDVPTSAINKSPRKSQKHTSPRSRLTSRAGSRSPSPTPRYRRLIPKQKMQGNVIEIMSSDEEPVRPRRPVARVVKVISDDDIIDVSD